MHHTDATRVPSTLQPLAGGKLFALMYPHPLDGLESTHPLTSRGSMTMNSYLFVAEDRAVLVDAGYSSDEAAMIHDIASVIGDRPLSIWATRIAEFNSICNIRPLVETFAVDMLYGAQNYPTRWVDFRPGFDLATSPLPTVDSLVIRTGDTVSIDTSGSRHLDALAAPLVLLPTNWIYDEESRTLITGDAFGHAWQKNRTDPVIVDSTDDFSDEDFAAYYASGRYWWLPGARTESIREEIAEIFGNHRIDRIAPSWGSILEGADVVQFHYEKLDQFLRDAPTMASVGIETGRLTFQEKIA